jgi:hypothetical protein
MPPLRLGIIEDLAEHRDSSTSAGRKRLDKPRATVDRQLQALHILGVVEVDEEELSGKFSGDGRSRWFYSLADGIDPGALNPESVPDLSVNTLSSLEEREAGTDEANIGSDKSGKPRRPNCICADQAKPCHWCQRVAS